MIHLPPEKHAEERWDGDGELEPAPLADEVGEGRQCQHPDGGKEVRRLCRHRAQSGREELTGDDEARHQQTLQARVREKSLPF